jgi:uncharacterized membrane protein YoaK (UPF0700 family)
MLHRLWTLTATRNALLLLLACAAGAADAVSYMELGRVFTANMTGNTVLLGLALVEAERQATIRAALALVGFLVGGALGAWIVERGASGSIWPPAVTRALALEWIILIVFAVDWLYVSPDAPSPLATGSLIVLSALAMGVQSTAARRLDVSGVATTYITGTLTNLVAWLVAWGVHANPGRHPVQPTRPAQAVVLLAAVWLVYLGGAAVAAAATILDRALAVVVPIAVVMIVIVTSTLRFRKE